MIAIEDYPRTFTLGGETVEMQKALLRKIKNDREEKCAFEGQIVAYDVNEDLGEYVIVLKYPDGFFCLSRKHGWFGPYRNVEAIEYDREKKVACIKAEVVLAR